MTEILYLEELTYEDVERLDKEKVFIFLPMGPVEAHGPHLPLGVDINGAIHTTKMAATKVAQKGYQPVIAPTMPYTLADVAMPFAGTITLSENTIRSFLLDFANSVAKHGFKKVVVFCHHGERKNFYALCDAAEQAEEFGIKVLISRVLIDGMRKLGGILKGEHPHLDFHAGESETALYLWKHPELVRKDIAATLPPNWSNIREKFKEGKKDFVEAGGLLGYFGAPALATVETGKKVYEQMATHLADEVEKFLRNS